MKMMDQISSKTGKVAEFPLKLNLQLFAEEEGYPSLEDSSEFNDDAREFNAKMDKYVEERTPKVETQAETETVEAEEVVKPEVVDPEKPKQDPETNKAFQEMRKAKEEAERKAAETEVKAKKADELIAQQYGHMGIYTVDQYEAALKADQEAKNAERYEESGLTSEEIEAIRNYRQVKEQLEQQVNVTVQEEKAAQWNSLYATYPELKDTAELFKQGAAPEWYTPEMAAEIARGASPIAAYRNAHFETIMQKTLGNTKEVAKQEALDQLNSKDHLAPNAATGGDVDHVDIDPETMRMYRSLNKGKSDAQIRAWHKKHAM
jgi:hypothetical protein